MVQGRGRPQTERRGPPHRVPLEGTGHLTGGHCRAESTGDQREKNNFFSDYVRNPTTCWLQLITVFPISSFVYILTLSFTTILHFPRQYYPFLSLHFQLFQPTPSADTNICYTKMSAGAHDCNNR